MNKENAKKTAETIGYAGGKTGISLTTLGFLTSMIFMILKLTNVISWSWCWVFFPLGLSVAIPIALFLIIVIIYIVVVAIAVISDNIY